MSLANITDPRYRLQPEQRREELVRASVELFAEGTFDHTHANEITKRAGVSCMLLYHYSPFKMAFVRAIAEYEILHLHGLVEQQAALTLEGAISTFTGYVKVRPSSLRAFRTGGLDQGSETAAALATSFERYEHLVLMLMGISEPDACTMFAAHVWISTVISLCLTWPDHLETSQETITNMSVQTLRSLVSQARQGVEYTSEPTAMPTTTPEPVGNR